MNNLHDTNEAPPISRRTFLQVVWQGLLGLGGALGFYGLMRYLTVPVMEKPKDTFDLGPVDQYLNEPESIIPEANAIVLNTAGGLLALSLVCPHLGCQVRPTDTGFTCPCHGSRFDQLGRRLSGRAQSDLAPLKLEQTPSADLILYK